MSEKTIDTKRFKVVFVGDCAVGKTCLLISFTENQFDEDHVPTVIDNRIQKVKYSPSASGGDEEDVILNLWDTAGQEDFDNLRLLSYPETDLFFVCFSVVSPSSLQNVKRLWMKEISDTGKAFTSGVPCILVGTKSDLRSDERTLHDLKEFGEEPVSFEQAQQFASENGFYAYRECSALTQEGIEQVIMTGIESKFNNRSPPTITTTSSSTTTPEATPATSSTTPVAGDESDTKQSFMEFLEDESTTTETQQTAATTNEVGATTTNAATAEQVDHSMWYPFIALLSLLKSCEIL